MPDFRRLLEENGAGGAMIVPDNTVWSTENEISTVAARSNFSEVVNRVAYGEQRVVLTRRGKIIAAIVPPHHLDRVGIKIGTTFEHEVSTVNARNRFSDVINIAAYGKQPVAITRHGKIVAAVVSEANLKRLLEVDCVPDGSPIVDWASVTKEKQPRAVRPAGVKRGRSYRKEMR